MRYTDYTMKNNGFVGHMAEPDTNTTGKGVIIIMGGEKSLIPGIKIAERFADFGITGLAVSLYGAKGLKNNVNMIAVDMFISAINTLKEKGIEKISVYGMSMGTVFASLIARYIGGIDALILCSPTHTVFEGVESDRKTMTDHSVATFKGQEIPYVKPDFSKGKMNKYVYVEKAKRKVMNMWVEYRNSYKDKAKERAAYLRLEQANARILLVSGTADEAWPSDYSAKYIFEKLSQSGYKYEHKLLLYPNASHLIGVMPNKNRNKLLYKSLPIISVFYKSFANHKEECMLALENSEKEIIKWILKD